MKAESILEKSGFRESRKYLVAMHDQFRFRARALEDSEENSAESVKPPESRMGSTNPNTNSQ
jgi:hypothetical protein